jgi:precorrin-6B methylase 2
MASELAPDSEWRTDPEDGGEFVAGIEGHRIEISVFEPKCLVMTIDEDAAGVADIRDVLAVIDKANLDPVRIAARELVTAIQREFDSRCLGDPSTELSDVLEKLEALL